MITIICATHRPQNQTQAVVLAYKQVLEGRGEEVKVLEMAELPKDFIYGGSFGEEIEGVQVILDEKIAASHKIVIVAPEYNGSFPGVFKAFIDSIPPVTWHKKKIALVGVATGRAGNLRGMDHLTGVLQYLKAEVYSNKLPISVLGNLLNEAGSLSDNETIALIREQLTGFLEF
jgi:NAD(P)H-dependent FMN reductase